MNNQASNQPLKLPFFYRQPPIIMGTIIVIFIVGGVFAWHYFRMPVEKVETYEEVVSEEELNMRERWLRVLDYQADVNNDGINEFFVIEKSRKEAPPEAFPYVRAYDVVAFFKDGKKLVEIWRKQVVLWKPPIEAIGVSVGDLDKNGINEILIMISGAPGHEPDGFLFEYNKDEVKLEQESKFIEITTIIMNRKSRDIKHFRYWSFEGIGDYDQDGVNEILTRYYWIDEVTAGPGSIIPISWEEINEEKRRKEKEVKIP